MAINIFIKVLIWLFGNVVVPLHLVNVIIPQRKDKIMMKKIICGVSVLLTVVGCQTSPRVVAEITERHSARSVDSVMIYKVGDPVPAEARAIGKVKCTDGGFTPTKNCLYNNMLALAVHKTAESGGNVLRIDKHKDPSLMGSTCHRIWGTMMIMPDSLVKTDVLTSLQKIEMNHDAEYMNNVKDREEKVKSLNNVPHDVFRLNAGPGWITSEIETPYSVYKRKAGFSISAAYQHYWNSGIGFGLHYMYYGTSFDNELKFKIHYVGPSLAVSYNLGKNWLCDLDIGFGYANYSENSSGYYNISESAGRIGMAVQMGIQYKFSDRVGLGFQLNTFRMSMKRPDGIDTSKYDFYGIQRIDTQLGLRFYL